MVILKSLILEPTQNNLQKLLYQPFLLRDGEKKNSRFQITFISQDIVYRYSLSYNADFISNEKLEIEKGDNFVTYFSREEDNIPVSPVDIGIASQTLRKNSLFLYLAQALNDKHATNVMRWFAEDLILLGDKIDNSLFKLLEDKMNKELFLRFLKAADFHIEDIDVRIEENELPNQFRQMMSQISGNELPKSIRSLQLYILHNSYDDKGNKINTIPISLLSESKGTQKIVFIALTILSRRRQSKVIVIDEFNDSLHLQLSQNLLDVFNSEFNINQFVLTTHELQLMDQNLRKDQIYFVEKDFEGNSNIFSLFDFEDESFKRSDISYMKRYLNGQFGGAPIIYLEGLLDAVKRSVEGDVDAY
jgi:hypothetical protein